MIETLLNIRWIDKDQDTIEKYHKFLFHLVTSKTEFLSLTLTRIVKNFVPNGE